MTYKLNKRVIVVINVIIVEDDPMVAKINREYVEQFSGFTVTEVFSNGKEALEYLKLHSPELAIIDIYMPVITGIDLLQYMRSSNIKTDVIMVTAANDVEMVNRALQLGIIDYLIKPFEYQRFQEAINKFLVKENLLSERRIVNQDIVDLLIKNSTNNLNYKSLELRKGLNYKTLSLIYEYIKSHPEQNHTCDSISSAISLSRVIVRRYLNYFIETGSVTSTVDYGTGGRPCILYHIK